MDRWTRLGTGLCLALVACGGAPAGAPSPSAPPAGYVVVGERPVLEHAAVGATWILSGAAVGGPEEQHLFPLVWVTDQDPQPRVAHLTSSDGTAWQRRPDVSFTGADALGLGRPGLVPSSVLRLPEGSWAMFGGGRLGATDRAVAWRATATTADGPWHVDPEPVLLPGDASAWDGQQVDHPSVVTLGDGLLMAYGGASFADRNAGRIGFARSTDGLTWTRSDAQPLSPAACDVASRSFVEPHLAVEGERLVLLFGAMEAGGDRMVVLRATSDDLGTTWECDPANPVLTQGDFPGVEGLHSMAALEIDGATGLLVETLGDGWSDVWLTRPGEAP